MIDALIDLYEADADPQWLRQAIALQRDVDTHYGDAVGGGYFRNPEDYDEDWQWAYGAGLGVTFSGPAGTLFRVRTTYGIDSSLPIDGAQGSFRLTMFKTFHGWWPRRKRAGEPVEPSPEAEAIDDAEALGEEAGGG